MALAAFLSADVPLTSDSLDSLIARKEYKKKKKL